MLKDIIEISPGFQSAVNIEYDFNDEGKISPKSFISTMRNLKRAYQKYRVLEIK